MPQERYHNYNRPVESLPENYRMAGLMGAGPYCGFDTFEIVAGNVVKMKHNLTGLLRLNALANANEGPFGCFTTRQGVIIYDDDQVQVSVNFPSTNPRIDLLVANHTHLDSAGGAPATYSIIQGAENANPVPPNLSLPLSQVKLGHFIVYPGGTHNTTIFVRGEAKKLGGQYAFTKATEEELGLGSEADFNKIQRTGVYFMDNVTANRPSTATPYWTLFVFKRGDKLVQMAWDNQSGRAHVRAATAFVSGVATTWGSWINLNNPDVPAVDLGPVNAAIGTRTYTQQNYVTNNQSLTASVDALDIALKAIDIILDQAVIDIDNLESAVGTRSYTENNILTDSESITASLEKFDKTLKALFTGDLNSILDRGVHAVGGSMSNLPYTGAVGLVFVNFNSLGNPVQRYMGDDGSIFYRIYNGSWGAWALIRYAMHVVDIGAWNMDTSTTKNVSDSWLSTNWLKVRGVKIVIQSDNDTNNNVYPLEAVNFAGDPTKETMGGIFAWSGPGGSPANSWVLNRKLAGTFDTGNFAASGAGGTNRGWINAEYDPR